MLKEIPSQTICNMLMNAHIISSKRKLRKHNHSCQRPRAAEKAMVCFCSILVALSSISAPTADKRADHNSLKGDIMVFLVELAQAFRHKTSCRAGSLIKSVCVHVCECVRREGKYHRGMIHSGSGSEANSRAALEQSPFTSLKYVATSDLRSHRHKGKQRPK